MIRLRPGHKFLTARKVRLAEGGVKGVIDGVTELVVGALRNPDGRSQYRLNVGYPLRMLVAQQDLVILTDAAGLVLMHKENDGYRRYVTERLRLEISDDRFAIDDKRIEPGQPHVRGRLTAKPPSFL
jgi:hypothetical protein